jgi:hypothetical protein
MAYVYPTPSTTYPYVVVETANITEDAGGISMATVQYVGILKPTKASSGDISWLPPAKQRLQPFTGRFNSVSVIVDFIYYTDVEPKDLRLVQAYGIGSLLPTGINGTTLYKSIVAPFTEENMRNRINTYGKRIEYYRSDAKIAPSLVGEIYSKQVYIGMGCVSHFSERIGLFYKVTNTYQDSGFQQVSGVGGGYFPYGSFAV